VARALATADTVAAALRAIVARAAAVHIQVTEVVVDTRAAAVVDTPVVAADTRAAVDTPVAVIAKRDDGMTSCVTK